MAPKRPLRIPLHTTGSSRFLTNSNSSQSSPLLRLFSRLVGPSQRRPVALILLALSLLYFFYSPSFASKPISSYAKAAARRRAKAGRPRTAPVHAASESAPHVGAELSLTAYLDARWAVPPAGVEHLFNADRAQLAMHPAGNSPHLWLTMYERRASGHGGGGTAMLHEAVVRLNQQRKLGTAHAGELLVGDQHEKQVYPPRPPPVQGKAVGVGAGGGLMQAKGGPAGKRETRLVVVCAGDECEKECRRLGWWCYTGYSARGKDSGDLKLLKAEIITETARKRDIFFVDSTARLTEDPYPLLEPLMIDYSIILQDPAERDADAAGHFGNVFYWFRRGRGGIDRWNDAISKARRGEYTFDQLDTLAFNRALDSASRVAPLDEVDQEAQAALPRRARKRPLTRVLGRTRYVLPANSVVVESGARRSAREDELSMAERPSFGAHAHHEVEEGEVEGDGPGESEEGQGEEEEAEGGEQGEEDGEEDGDMDAEVEADAQLQRELEKLDHDFEDDMVNLDQQEEAAALGEMGNGPGEEEEDTIKIDEAPKRVFKKQQPQRIKFADEAEPVEADNGEEVGEPEEEEEVLEPDEFPEDRQAEEEIGTELAEEDVDAHEHKQVDFDDLA